MNAFVKIHENGGTYYLSENIGTYHRFGTKLGPIKNEKLVLMHQVHSARTVYVTERDCGTFIDGCDALITDRKGVPIAVKTADCVPILFYASQSGIIAAAHAGWRGTIARIAPSVFRRMTDMGAVKSDIMIAVGAAIHDCCYEVKEDFRDAVKDVLGDRLCGEFVRNSSCGAPYRADIVGLNERLLLEEGALPENISVCDKCTCCDPLLFCSYRATGLKETMRAVITM